MKICTKCAVEKPLSDYRLEGERSRASCRACDRIVSQDWKKRNQDRVAEYAREKYRSDPERFRSEARDRSANDPLRRSRVNLKFYQKNADRMRARSRQYAKDRPDLNRLRRSIRRAAEKTATPSWANRKKMAEFYTEAVRLTELTGIAHHVDHIVPLQSPWVCGLHCEANLQILPYYENQSKSNRTWPEMPDLSGETPILLAA